MLRQPRATTIKFRTKTNTTRRRRRKADGNATAQSSSRTGARVGSMTTTCTRARRDGSVRTVTSATLTSAICASAGSFTARKINFSWGGLSPTWWVNPKTARTLHLQWSPSPMRLNAFERNTTHANKTLSIHSPMISNTDSDAQKFTFLHLLETRR